MEYKYTPQALAAQALDDATRVREFLTGIRNGLIADGWTPKHAERAVCEALANSTEQLRRNP